MHTLSLLLLKALSSKVDVPNSVIYLHQTPIFERHVVRCDSKNGYQKNNYSKQIGLHAQSLVTILGSKVNII